MHHRGWLLMVAALSLGAAQMFPQAGRGRDRDDLRAQTGHLAALEIETHRLPTVDVRSYRCEQWQTDDAALAFLCLGDPGTWYEVEFEGLGAGRPPLDPVAFSSPIETEETPPTTIGGSVVEIEAKSFAVTDAAPRRFFLPVPGTRGEAVIETRSVAQSAGITVYAEIAEQTAPVLPELAIHAARLAQAVMERGTPRYGACRDVDGDGHLSLVLTSRLADLSTPGGRLDGCVRWQDFCETGVRPTSNAADVIFLNPQIPDLEQLHAVLAHEYAHLLTFTRRGIGLVPSAVPDEDWLNEAVAHVLEVELSPGRSNLSPRLQAFIDHPEQSPLVVSDAELAGLWRNPGSRGAGYLFIDWLRRKGSRQEFDHLLSGPERGVALVEAIAGAEFEVLWSAWAQELWSCGVDAGDETGLRRQPAAVQLPREGASTVCRMRGMSVIYLTRPATAEIRVGLPRTAAWREVWSNQRPARDRALATRSLFQEKQPGR